LEEPYEGTAGIVYRLGLRYKSIGKWQGEAFTVRNIEASYY